MITLYLGDVGDGLAAGLRTVSHCRIQIDCGSLQSQEEAFNRGLLRINPEIFFLSHFHVDHYNGLFPAVHHPSQFRIREVYFPRIPQFPDRKPFLRSMLAMDRFLAGNMGKRSGSQEGDFLHLISRINRRSFTYRPLSLGDEVQIEGAKIAILWPPRVLDDENTLKVISGAVSDFDAAINEDETLRQIYDLLAEKDQIEPYLAADEKLWESERQTNPEDELQYLLKDPRELSEIVKRANTSLRTAANHLSLAMHEDNRFLFMGDLEATEIGQVVSEVLRKDRDHFLVMITPHHGTHWHPGLSKLRCWWALSSVGDRRFKNLRPEFKSNADECLITYLFGDIHVPLLNVGTGYRTPRYLPTFLDW